MNSLTERRALSRMPLDQPVLLRFEGRTKPLVVHGVDVSHSGVCVNLSRPTGNPPVITREFSWYYASVVRVDRVSRLLDKMTVVGLKFTGRSDDPIGPTDFGGLCVPEA